MNEKQLEQIFETQCGLTKAHPILVGLSGGPDSLCLLESLRRAGYLVIIAHFDHQLRPESAEDAERVIRLAKELQVECFVQAGSVRDHARTNKFSIEEAARRLRYEFFYALARQVHAQAVAVGHTADDQVETVLLHLLRGSGLAGLQGMSYRVFLPSFDAEIPLVRPLLDLLRRDTEDYCRTHGLSPLYDSSNASCDFKRNRIRHQLIPQLESYNPRVREAIIRMARLVKEDHALVDEIVSGTWSNAVLSDQKDLITLDRNRLSSCSPALQRKLLRRALQTLDPAMNLTHALLSRAVEFVSRAESGSRIDLGEDFILLREGGWFHVKAPGAALPVGDWPQMLAGEEIPVLLSGMTRLAEGWRVRSQAEVVQGDRSAIYQNQDPRQVWLNAEILRSPLLLRSRRTGDRFAPLGMQGRTQKMSDFFVNEKIPQRARNRWPLLCMGNEIIWVTGLRLSHHLRIQELTQKLIHLTLLPPGEPGSP